MFSKLFKLIKNFFFVPVPNDYKTEFNIDVTRVNIAKIKHIAITFIVLEVIMIIASFIVKKENFLKKPDIYYFAMYVLLIIAITIFWRVFAKLEKDIPRHQTSIQITGVFFTIFLLSWCAGISLLDQLSYGQIIIYISAIIAIAVIPLFQPITFFIIYMVAQALFVGLMPYFQKSDEAFFGNLFNTTLLIFLSLVIARLRYSNYIEDFKNKKTIQEKSNEIKKINIELKEANQKLEKLSQMDSLTGIFNRSAFDRILKKEWNRCKRYSLPLSLFMIDIDLFKKFNDKYGHQAGDDCIKQIAGVLSASLKRSSDTVSRYGGDEFSVILPNVEEGNALKLVEHLRAKVEGLAIRQACNSVNEYVTISIGAHTIIPSDKSSIDEFIKAADKALYKDKKERSNKNLCKS